jgi:hypothetical protein
MNNKFLDQKTEYLMNFLGMLGVTLNEANEKTFKEILKLHLEIAMQEGERNQLIKQMEKLND